MRADLADVRLAGRVFVPHFAAPMAMAAADAAPVSAAPGRDVVATLAAGERFEVLEIVADRAWGIAPDRACVGYVELSLLVPA